MSISLTEGAVPKLWNGEAVANKMTLVVQVFDIRLLNTQNQNSSSERYRILVSDGVHLLQGMLAIQLNDLVKSEGLQKGSIIKMTSFACNEIQSRMIVIITGVDLVLSKCDLIGNPQPYNGSSINTGMVSKPDVGGGPRMPSPEMSNAVGGVSRMPSSEMNHTVGGGPRMPSPELNHTARSHYVTSSATGNPEAGRYDSMNMPPTSLNNYLRPPLSSYQQPPPMYMNRGPVAKNEAPPRIIPIAALNPYQGRWTIKARVTAKGELRFYSNPRGDGKVFSFDLLDSDGGEIRVTCFNSVADQFYNQIEAGKVYLVSKGSLKPAQKAFNHLHNDHEIVLDTSSTIQLCSEDDKSIPQQQFHFRPISDIESMENNSVVDVIGVVSSISPSTSIMRKNGTETQRRILHVKDMSGRSVELTLWGNFCNAEGQMLQNRCDSGVFPVIAVKSGRVNDFNGKAVGTISASQLLIEPDFPEARALRAWFDQEGRNTPSLSISRETTSIARAEVRKTISQIKDERLGTSEKPDWITVSATLSFIKMDNFCYTACPIILGDRKCSKKVINNGDGKWRCDRCDQSIDECDYRYILQFQIQDHTGLTWVTAFQECGEEIMGISAKDLYYLKYEEQDDEKFSEIVHKVLFTKYTFKLKVKEEMFSDEQRVKSTVVKAEKVNFASETRFLIDLMGQLKGDCSSSVIPKTESIVSSTGPNITGFVNHGRTEPASPVANYVGGRSNFAGEMGMPANQVGQYGNQYNGSRTASTGMYLSCNSCGSTSHNSTNCPSVMNGQGQFSGGGFDNRLSSGPSSAGGGASGECFKCHQLGHWAKNCPNTSNASPAYGSGNIPPGRYGSVPKQHVGGF